MNEVASKVTSVSRRRPGEGRYAKAEREQRWLLSELPQGITGKREILDQYLIGTTLRLRRVESDNEVVYKLAQKVRPNLANPERVNITNIYLSFDEYVQLSAMASHDISKCRWDYAHQSLSYAIDEFGGRLVGLLLAEVEIGDTDPRLTTPDFAVTEVTSDNRYSGGWLAEATDSELRDLIG